jgi:hypothetical protein
MLDFPAISLLVWKRNIPLLFVQFMDSYEECVNIIITGICAVTLFPS